MLTWIVRFLDGSEKKYTTVSELIRDTKGRNFSDIAYSYRPNIITLIEEAQHV